MRTALDLLDLPFSFHQLPALTEHEYVAAAKYRGVHLTPQLLEGLHRLRVFPSLLRFRRRGCDGHDESVICHLGHGMA